MGVIGVSLIRANIVYLKTTQRDEHPTRMHSLDSIVIMAYCLHIGYPKIRPSPILSSKRK
jgi:hypothetical protein